MPSYSYKCKECEFEIELVQKFSDEPLKKCYKCGGEVYRVIFAVPVHYKGPGFFTTEQRNILGYKRKPNIKVGLTSELSEAEQERTK